MLGLLSLILNLHNPISIEWQLFALHMLLGCMMGIPVTCVTCLCVYGRLPKMEINIQTDVFVLINVIVEEFLWRHILLWNMDGAKEKSIVMCVLVGFALTFLFVFSHRDVRCARDFMEMYLFSLVLLAVASRLPGMNIGLHWVRNMMCKESEVNTDGG